MCSCRATISLARQQYGGIAHTNGVLPLMDIGSLRRMGEGGEERKLPFM